MGAVKEDVRKKEREWVYVNLSDPDSVKGLLKCRSRFDLLYDRGFSDLNDIDVTNIDIADQLEEVICLYAWIDDIIKRTKWTDQQKRILAMIMREYTTEEIALVEDTTERNINKIVDTICKKITDMALRDWRKWAYTNKLGLKTKKCAKCGEELPATDEFFSSKNDSKDGFHPYCKECRK